MMIPMIMKILLILPKMGLLADLISHTHILTNGFVDSDYEVEMEEPVLLLPREDHEEDHFMY